jgi:PKD repeat protein
MGVGTDYTSTETTDAGSIIQVIKQLHPVEFTDSSTNADSVLWNFGDGNTSTERNPIHNYSSNGTFIVTLTAYNEFGEDSTTQSVVVTGIGVDYYEQEVEEEVEEVEEEEPIELEADPEDLPDVEEEEVEEVIAVDDDVQTFNIDVPSIPEVEEEVISPKDEEEVDYTEEVTYEDEETTTTQTTTTTTTQPKSNELTFEVSAFDRYIVGYTPMFVLVDPSIFEILKEGSPITLTRLSNKAVHSRVIERLEKNEDMFGFMVDAPIDANHREPFEVQITT